jgi:hypothetical protein
MKKQITELIEKYWIEYLIFWFGLGFIIVPQLTK